MDKELLGDIDIALSRFSKEHGLEYHSRYTELKNGEWHWTAEFYNPINYYIWGYSFTSVFFENCPPNLSISGMIIGDMPKKLLRRF